MICQLEKSCFGDDAHGYLDVLGMLTLPGYVRLKALVGEQMVGFIIAERRRIAKPAWIDAIGVSDSYRRRGIAKALLAACEQRLNAPTICLYVRRSNQPAIRLYEQNGYYQAKIRYRYYVDKEDALVMEKTC